MMHTPDQIRFQTGVRLARAPALITGAVIFFVHLLWQDSLLFSFITGVFFALLVFLLIYANALYLLRKRISSIRTVIRKTPKEQMEPTTMKPSGIRDEVDLLAHESDEVYKATHGEFQRMDETENYRKEFIGDISHELKTPIFTVQGYLETLQAGALEDPKVNYRFLTKAMDNVNRLIYLTEDLMEISKLETGELNPEFEMIPLNTVIRDVIENLQYKARENEVNIIFEQKASNIFAYTDRNQLRQILVNLIENAIKYNKKGGYVMISVRHLTDPPRKILVSVQDTGIGLKKEDQARVTERFYRVDKSRSREQGGTGLGLAIVKHILESHKEKLIIESTPGKGSTFRFTVRSADEA